MPDPATVPEPDDATIYRHARQEARLVMLVWLAALIYTLVFCTYAGYEDGTAPLRLIGGIPSWVYWGVVVPWIAAIAFTTWFCFRFMADDYLGADEEAHIEHGEGTLDAR